MVGIYEQNPKTVSAIQLSMSSWDEVVKMGGSALTPSFGEDKKPMFHLNDTDGHATIKLRIGDWLVQDLDGIYDSVSDSLFRSNYKRRIPRKAKDDAAPAAKKKVKAA